EMVSLKLQKRLASSVLKCGKGKVWRSTPMRSTRSPWPTLARTFVSWLRTGSSSGSPKRSTQGPVHAEPMRQNRRAVILDVVYQYNEHLLYCSTPPSQISVNFTKLRDTYFGIEGVYHCL
uniref:Ribosomal protein L19e N-terminal domain-containing protein n=2 Tax=Aegilops tauschii subsp. strangulata TaxID=200361 RepID=A0A453I555_AEGTS